MNNTMNIQDSKDMSGCFSPSELQCSRNVKQ